MKRGSDCRFPFFIALFIIPMTEMLCGKVMTIFTLHGDKENWHLAQTIFWNKNFVDPDECCDRFVDRFVCSCFEEWSPLYSELGSSYNDKGKTPLSSFCISNCRNSIDCSLYDDLQERRIGKRCNEYYLYDIKKVE